MPDVPLYTFDHKELLFMLIKAAGVRDGEWMLQFNFGFTAGNFGPDDDHLNPGAIAFINHVAIAKAGPGAPKGLVINAREVNPSST